MKNTVLRYESEKIGETKIRDYFSKNVNLYKIKEDFPQLAKYFKNGSMTDNDTPERLANMLYSNPDLWDFILLTNNRDPLFGLPYDFDSLRVRAGNRLDKFMNEHPRINITPERKSEILMEFIKELELENESNRVIQAVQPKNLSTVITTLRQAGVI